MERYQYEELGIDGRLILKGILKIEWKGVGWIDLV